MVSKDYKDYLFAVWKLKKRFINVKGTKTAVHLTNDIKTSQETLVLIHGLDGSHDGMKPLGYELRHDYNVVFVDLPGHGSSELPQDYSVEYLDSWARLLVSGLREEGINIDRIIAHSFGCRIAASIFAVSHIPTIFLMPVPDVSKTYRRWAKGIYFLRSFFAMVHNIRWYSAARGFSICRDKSRQTWRLMRWLGSRCHPGYSAVSYRLAIAARMDSYQLPNSSKVSIVSASHDMIPETDFFELGVRYPKAFMQLFLGGHLAPIENPIQLARELRRTSLI